MARSTMTLHMGSSYRRTILQRYRKTCETCDSQAENRPTGSMYRSRGRQVSRTRRTFGECIACSWSSGEGWQ
jgi:hypothetical protein